MQAPHTCSCLANVVASAELPALYCSRPCSGHAGQLCGSPDAVRERNEENQWVEAAPASIAVYEVPPVPSVAAAACAFGLLPEGSTPRLSSLSKLRVAPEVEQGADSPCFCSGAP